MIKGVNKQIIEVNNPESIYFEKVVFYLRTGVQKLPTEISRREIDRFLGNENSKFKKKARFIRFLRFLTYIAIISIILIFILFFFR